MPQLSRFLFHYLRNWMYFQVQPLFHSMDTTEISDITWTKLWKSVQNFGRPNKTLEEFFSKIPPIVVRKDYCQRHYNKL
jgi:hypothetical protein